MVVIFEFFLVFTMVLVVFMVFGGCSWFLQWLQAPDHQNHNRNSEGHEFSSFPNIASVGFATNPHNLSLYISSTTRDAVGLARAATKTFVFTCFMKDSELHVSSRDPVI